jgi:hypothetical protein
MSNVPWLNETERANYWKSAWETERKESDKLQSQLVAKDAEIARLTKALRKADIDCDHCKHNHGDECENPDFDCMTCDCDCICKSCRDNSNWEWREAGEGDLNG